MPARSTLYDQDFYAWSRRQADLLRSGKVSEADIANIAEEIESIGKGEKRELASRLTVLILHLAKWRFQPNSRSRSWRLGIEGQRIDIAELLDDNPSLRGLVPELLPQAWRRAVIDAQRETGLDASAFPPDCPWTSEQCLDAGFWPE